MLYYYANITHNVPWTKDQLTDLLKSFDKDNNGQLSWDEVKAAFEFLGSNWFAKHIRTAIALYRADADKNGSINLSNSEFSAFVDYVLSCGFKVD
ncbi:Parvalbumin [Parasponia andersonii]|uniref:Parvalbumin n=1 Tax=Parasponia andersonii TaxID=3476 RepID=A0A2P5AGD0_PARAD|nr:Parvalbumin [Parasponia andersonii]